MSKDNHPAGMVVLDVAACLTSDDRPSELARGLRNLANADSAGPQTYRADMARRIADQIEAQTKPPKPVEPTGLGAVVEDAEGTDWHRNSEGRWLAADGLRTRAGGWGHIDAVRVLSEGVTG